MLKISEYLENTRTCGNIIRCPVYTLVVSVENICKRRERSGSREYAMLCHILHYCIPSSLGWGWAMISEQTDYNLSRCWQILFQCCICSTPPTPVPPFSIESTMKWKVEIQIHFSKLSSCTSYGLVLKTSSTNMSVIFLNVPEVWEGVFTFDNS